MWTLEYGMVKMGVGCSCRSERGSTTFCALKTDK